MSEVPVQNQPNSADEEHSLQKIIRERRDKALAEGKVEEYEELSRTSGESRRVRDENVVAALRKRADQIEVSDETGQQLARAFNDRERAARIEQYWIESDRRVLEEQGAAHVKAKRIEERKPVVGKPMVNIQGNAAVV